MTPVWSPEAISDFVALRARIEQNNPAPAQRIALRILYQVDTLLADNPQMGRPGPYD